MTGGRTTRASRATATKRGATKRGATSRGATKGGARKKRAATRHASRIRHNVAPLPDPPAIGRRKSRVHGWGVFALQSIPKNKRIIDYAGEKITNRESSPREERYLTQGHIWCFKLNSRWAVDAAVGGNIARFINHGCKPNCYAHIANGVIWIRAGKNIRKGQELTYNYNTEGAAEIPCRCRPGCKNQL